MADPKQETPRVKHLGQITDEIIDGWIGGWAERFEKRDGGHYCKVCGSQVMQTTCYVSIHLKMFEPACVGSGKVEKINYPFCPKCDGDIDHVTACYHVEVMEDTEFRVEPHGTLPSRQMIEFWRGGQLVAGIYPHQDGIRVVSKYMTGVEKEAGLSPAAVIFLGKEPVGEG
ncbi:unnamed protein product [marine sediment metagenome]|uniref:Uncharacterized protein n=1 Tax=marine sediment metagenome TaxID=412755 RepID=X1R5S5_9ZZZZ